MNKWSVVLLCTVALFAGCHGDASQAPTVSSTPRVKAAPAAKRGPTPEELTAGMVEAVTMGKSTVPVAVKFDLPEKPVMGQAVEVVVAVMPQISADLAVLTVKGSDGLPLPDAAPPIEMPSVEPTQVYRHNVKVVPTGEGVQLLEIDVALKHDDVTETRVFSVPLIVSPATGAASGLKH
jgi:hypothetical protein